MCNALTVTKRESAPLPERLCEQIAYCAILFTAFRADYSVVVAQSEGADHCYYSTPEMQNILLQNAVSHAVRKAKNFAGGATDAILSGHQVLINLMSDFVLDKTKATAEGHQWESYTLEHIANNARFAAGGQCDQCAGLLVGYSCSLTLPCRDVFQVCDPIFVRLYSLRNCSRAKAHGANLSDSCSIFLRRLFRAGDGVLVDSLLVILCTCKAMRRSSSHHGDDSYYSDSLALRRWRRLISPFAAVTKKPAVLSPGSLSCSISSITSCGILTVVICDFAFFAPVAISGSPKNWCMSVYAKKMIKKGLKCISPVSKLKSKGEIHLKEQRPAVLATHAGRLTTNDSKSIEVAMGNHTTHPQGRDSHNLNKYIWRFIALSTAQPRVIHIEAISEQEARQQSPDGCVMVFAARIRQGVSHA
ncbi:host cell division inhibitor Icd-like protein [Escherichia coli]|nr:host cell division inhibitor Icd-like protein [Escherichia coli]EEY7924740.1 host cell division inhibitor Icd-like protein [Escherichia coli]EFK8696274.1 ash family protein [Escherichia coli]EFN7778906.1 host cell division inhibitor Icd-like protein [Escherichia coli]EHP8183014.1 host cell division inhibitor Icd-like protein [Escherichia coli]EHY6383581.1 host cell division inhibitor Icd-like protein [Escherichia coli]